MRVLIFGTLFVDTFEKYRLMVQWAALHGALNPKCDLMLVDSASPNDVTIPYNVQLLQLGNNIGHLGGRVGGSVGNQDGWGRAFCAGLQYAIENYYDYAVHVEGDSLCRLDVMRECASLREHGICAVSVPVRGTKHHEKDWLETGLMFLDVEYTRREHIVSQYDWKNSEQKKYPYTPEWWLFQILGQHRVYANWRTIRDDKRSVDAQAARNYDWITHADPKVYDTFVAHNMPKVSA